MVSKCRRIPAAYIQELVLDKVLLNIKQQSLFAQIDEAQRNVYGNSSSIEMI